MNSLFFYIGLGVGLALACGLRPFLPALLAGGLASQDALGVDFAHGPYDFLQSGWWLVAVTAALAASYMLQFLLGSERLQAGLPAAALTGLGVGMGALLFAGTLGAHGDMPWPGLIAGGGATVLGQRAIGPLLAGARARLTDLPAREALTLYVDAVALVVAALVALVHTLGYVMVVLFAWLAVRTRRRTGEKYSGLRILGR
jgi:Domain of unknown function (DUF4126)